MAKAKMVYQVSVSFKKNFTTLKDATAYAARLMAEAQDDVSVEIESYEVD